LSPHLHFGEISPRQIWHCFGDLAERERGNSSSSRDRDWRHSQFIAELGWREFAHHLLYHFPHTASEPLRAEFAHFPWRRNRDWLKAWQSGKTGYPLIDAGMRELWHTGWMHNRVRMAVASFLVKDLLISWQEGARWFWDTLVDADLAQNTLGWQWTAGCGADAAPFFRIFNPTTQAKKFDPDGAYIRRWVPELADVPAECVHEPHARPREAPGLMHPQKGEQAHYPDPVVSHVIAREIALEAYNRLRG
jgi:deoxyribodipyrimidine photo-lyase